MQITVLDATESTAVLTCIRTMYRGLIAAVGDTRLAVPIVTVVGLIVERSRLRPRVFHSAVPIIVIVSRMNPPKYTELGRLSDRCLRLDSAMFPLG